MREGDEGGNVYLYMFHRVCYCVNKTKELRCVRLGSERMRAAAILLYFLLWLLLLLFTPTTRRCIGEMSLVFDRC